MKVLICIISLALTVGLNSKAADAIPGEYLVKTHNKALLKNATQLPHDLYKVVLTPQEAKKLESKVEYIEPNYVYHALPTSEDSPNVLAPKQWGLTAIDAEKAWGITKGSRDVIVAVIDTGIDCSHPALKDHCDQGWDFVKNKKDGIDDQGHGTHCAGIIAANSAVKGVAPNITLLAVKFLDSQGSGTLENAILAIEYAVKSGAKILSNSWGGYGSSKALQEAIEEARDQGVLFVAAAGNEYNNNDETPSYPASYPVENIISVGSSDQSNNKSYFSNYGKKSVHLFAPGSAIYSTLPNNKYGNLSGTSMATPFVSGAAGLILSKYPDCDYVCLQNRLLSQVTMLDAFLDISISGGLLNVYNSIK